MKKVVLWIILLTCTLCLAQAAPNERSTDLSRAQLQGIIEFLAADQLAGRAPGTSGGEITELYLQSLCQLFDLQPGAGSGYFQPFALQGYTTEKLLVSSPAAEFRQPEDVMGNYTGDESEFNLEGEAVFCGFGIVTPTWDWNDYKTDVKGKILIIRTNDPGMFRPEIFEGQIQTYYGRWVYKMEEAARHGASAVLLIHTDESAGYGWSVVQNSWAGESLYLSETINNSLKFRGWLREESVKNLLAERGIDLQELYQKSLRKNFTPVSLGIHLRLNGRSNRRDLQTRNVVAHIPGRSDRTIVLSAHIDHLGSKNVMGNDGIFNGAIDNASAVAALFLTAKLLRERQEELYYSVDILACQAEEGGLLGSYYYVRHADRSKIIFNINFESSPVWEKARDFYAEGARFLDIEDTLRVIGQAAGLRYGAFSLTNLALFYRSDQFPFARNHIPAIWLSTGEDFESGRNRIKEFFVNGDYHTVKDEFHPEWELASLRQTVGLAVRLVEEISRRRLVPGWKSGIKIPFSFDKLTE